VVGSGTAFAENGQNWLYRREDVPERGSLMSAGHLGLVLKNRCY